MWTVYIIKNSISKELYIGITNDLERRLREHNHGFQTATKCRLGEWQLIYCEQYRVKNDAVVREKKLKHHGRAKQELYKRIQQSLSD